MNASALNYIPKRGSRFQHVRSQRRLIRTAQPRGVLDSIPVLIAVPARMMLARSCSSVLVQPGVDWSALMESAKFIHSKSVVKVPILEIIVLRWSKTGIISKHRAAHNWSARCLALSKTSKTCCYPFTGVRMREGAVRSRRQN